MAAVCARRRLCASRETRGWTRANAVRDGDDTEGRAWGCEAARARAAAGRDDVAFTEDNEKNKCGVSSSSSFSPRDALVTTNKGESIVFGVTATPTPTPRASPARRGQTDARARPPWARRTDDRRRLGPTPRVRPR